MAGLTDITTPVIVNVKTINSLKFSIDNHFRRMALVSAGETKAEKQMRAGDYVVLSQSNYIDYLVQGSRTLAHAKSFFQYAGNKELLLIEVGSESEVNTISAQCDCLKNFLIQEYVKCFNVIVPDSWFNPQDKQIVHSFQISSQADKVDISTLQAGQADNDITIDFLSDFDEVQATIEYAEAETDENKKALQYIKETKKLSLPELKELPDNPATLKLVGTNQSNTATATITITLEKQAVQDAKAVQEVGTYTEIKAKDLGFSKLAQEYNTWDKSNLFFVSAPYPETTSVIEAENYYKGYKSVHIVIDSQTNKQASLVGQIVGKTASSYFDISTDTPASPLNFKSLAGTIVPLMSQPEKQQMIQNSVTFADSVAGQTVIMNGRQMDTKTWEYYYFFYLVEFAIKSKIQLLILNGVNNPTSAVNYNQDGIDTIKANILAVLNEYKDYGVIQQFAQGYDENTATFSGTQNIVSPDFYTYIAENPDDYQNEIIGGFSCYLQIGKFVRQVIFNVTLTA